MRIGGDRLEGRPAPDITLETADGRAHRLGGPAERWRLLVFHRHLG